jgi:hypothetical protein
MLELIGCDNLSHPTVLSGYIISSATDFKRIILSLELNLLFIAST